VLAGSVLLSCLIAASPPGDAASNKTSTSVADQAPAEEAGPADVLERAPSPEAGAEQAPWWAPYSPEFIVIPLYTQNPDAGPTALGAASLYIHDGKTKPYKMWVSGVASGSWAGVFSATGYLEFVRPWDTPLRFIFSGGYQTTLAGHYCGTGNQVSCDVQEAERGALNTTTTMSGYDDFVRRYYRYRYHGPVGTGTVRWMVRDKPHRIEAVMGARGAYYFPGSFGFSGIDPAPYPGSKYAQQFPDGELGALNIVEGGLMFDNRDQEAGPTRGYWVEASLRSASQLTLSDWSFGGVNVTARGYLPLTREKGRLVLTERFIFDAIVGDVPTYELQRVGGSWAYAAFGGQDVGRGIRQARVMGKVKIISQTELRALLLNWKWFGIPFEVGAVGFVDAGYIAADWRDVGRELPHINWGFGAGLRLRMMQNLLFRIELGFSPDEGFSPQPYLWPAWPW
jgi:hypothetical protein